SNRSLHVTNHYRICSLGLWTNDNVCKSIHEMYMQVKASMVTVLVIKDVVCHTKGPGFKPA
ncbi:hypothetical protein SK128_009632, partial [Halocaridina rubra]